ncbi:MAG: hypothetical protein WBF93_20045 [Pirellulales bacterium]
MDKLKPYLDGLKKHHFWLITAICVLVTLYCWNSATSEIQTDFTKNKGKVNNQFTKIGEINRRPKFPNADWKEDAAKKNTEVANQIKKAADRIVKDQKAALTWSPVWSPALQELAKTELPDKWPEDALEEFRLQMPEDVKRLRTILHAADGVSAAGVQWNAEDYDSTLSAFTLNDIQGGAIMTMRSRYWVFETLVKIIAETNEGVEDKYNLPIHDLEVLAVGDQNAKTMLPDQWAIAGATATEAVRSPPEMAGYTLWPVRVRMRMDLKYLYPLLAACANSDLPFEIKGLRIQRPSGLVEVKPQEEEPAGRFHVAPRGAGFGGRKIEEEKQEEKEPEVAKRGTLVEIVGDVYLVNEQGMQGEISKTGGQTSGRLKLDPLALLVSAGRSGNFESYSSRSEVPPSIRSTTFGEER